MKTNIQIRIDHDEKYLSNVQKSYIDILSYIERLHRLMLDVIKDEFERIGMTEVNSVQALLIFNIGDNEVTAGELRTKGYYQGTNVSYSLKKMVESGYIHQKQSQSDKRSIRIKLTEKGQNIRNVIAKLLEKHVKECLEKDIIIDENLAEIQNFMRKIEIYWGQQIRFLY